MEAINEKISLSERRFVGLVCQPLQALFKKKLKLQKLLNNIYTINHRNNKNMQLIPYI